MSTTRETVKIVIPEAYTDLDNREYRYLVYYGGRSAARSWSIARKLLRRGMKEKILVLCTRELQKSIKQSVHRLLKNQIELLKMQHFYDVKDSFIRGANGTEFIFLGLRYNTDEVKSTEGIDVAWIEEAHALSEDSFDLIDPTVRKDGSQIILSFNTRFKFDFTYQYFCEGDIPPDAMVKKTTHEDNPFITDRIITQMERMKEQDYEKYLHIWKGELKILAEGAVFGEQFRRARKEGRVTDFPITNAEVYTFWDLGKNNQTAIWFLQKVGHEYRFVDYYESRLKDIPHYCKVIKGIAPVTPAGEAEKCLITAEANARRQSYNYATHYMPHDISHDMLGMERTRQAQFESGGVKPIEKVPVVKSLDEGIEMVRGIFPECYFHKTFAERGIECLANYRYNYSEDRDTYTQNPHHDWASNGADSFRQFAQGFKEKTERKDSRKKSRRTNGAGAWMG